MIGYRDSRISAHHNYLVNDLLTPGFVMGDPNSRKGFYFLADFLLPGESTPRLSARLLDEQGNLLLELNRNHIGENPGGCSSRPIPGGFQILRSEGTPLLEVRTQNFTNGYLTRIRGRLFDGSGDLRMETLGESIQVHGDVKLDLEAPLPH